MFKNKFVLSVIGFYIFYLGILPFVSASIIQVLCANFSMNSAYKIEVNNPRVIFSVLPRVTIKADSIKVKAPQNSLVAETENFKIKLRLLPLLSGHIHINNLAFSELKFSASLNESLELDKDFFKKLETTRVKCDSLNIKSLETKLYQKELNRPIIYTAKDFSFQKKNKYLKLKLDGSLNISDKVSSSHIDLFLPKNNDIRTTIFDVKFRNFDLAPLRVYFKHYLPKDVSELRGVVNIEADKGKLITKLANCAVMFEDSAKSIVFPELMTVKSRFSIKSHLIDLQEVEIDSQNIKASLDGKIYNYFGKTMPTLNLNLRVNKSKVEDIINIVPAFKVEEIDTYKLKKYKLYGDTLANITVKGRLPEPDVTGDVFINNAVLVKPIPNTTQGATIKLTMTGRYANFDVYVPAGDSQKVWVNGTQELYNIKFADMTIKSTDSVSLSSAQDVLIPLHEILNFIIGPVPIMDLKGQGNIDILVKGNRKNPHVWGVFNAKNSTVNFKEIQDLKLVDADASLTFNDQDVVLMTKKGTLNGKDFDIKGSCNLFGKFDFDIVSLAQSTSALYKGLSTSTMFPEINKMLPKIDKITGQTDLKIKVHGLVKSLDSIKFNENVFVKGDVVLRNNSYSIDGIEVVETNGNIKLDSLNAEANVTAKMGTSPLSVKAKIKKGIADLVLDIPRLNPNFLITDKDPELKQYLPFVSVLAKYKGNIDEIEYNKLYLIGKVLESNPKSDVKFSQDGVLEVANGKIVVKNLSGYIDNEQNKFFVDLKINDAFCGNPTTSGNIEIKAPDLTLFNGVLTGELLPKNIKIFTKEIEFLKGSADIICRFNNNKLSFNTDLAGISFKYLPFDLPIEIINGNLSVKNNVLKLNKINMLADKMPVLLDGDIKDIFDKKIFNLYLNSKPQQEFIDKYINKNQIYPIKIKGDIVYWATAKGVADNFELKSRVDISKDSSIYHYGATVGDIENAIALNLDSRVINKNNLRIKEFAYDKLIDSLNGKQTELNMLKARGGVAFQDEEIFLKDLRIKTSHPTDARIFNIIFRKPNIKQGQFTSDLKFDGKLSNPHIVGDFHIFETNIPFFDTNMKNIELLFKEKTIDISSKGDILGNDVEFSGVMKNKLTVPYQVEKAYFYTKNLNLNQVVDKLKLAEVDDVSNFESFGDFGLSSICFDNFKFKADNIQLRNIYATNFEANTSLNSKGIFDVESFIFNIAQGTLNGKYRYNLKNNDMKLNLDAKDINANDITWALFDLHNQIYGDMTGTVNLTCNGTNFESCMQSLNGNTTFNVKNGRMPKLGSLEYLLKAGNLIRGGITGLSINSVIDIITPLKTGEFSNIFGNVRIKDGVARNLEITTNGKDLSLYIAGTYNFATSIADMEVFGLLSRNISTMFGPIGNLSINTLFNVIPGVDLSKDSVILEKINKIPAIEFSSKAYRRFIAVIKGDIDGDDYVTSFRWIN